jgi:predicted transcriptional regulator
MSVATANPVAIKLDPEIKERLKRLAGTRHRTEVAQQNRTGR